MKVPSPYQCDYCLNQKGETNHWWLRPQESERFTLMVWNDALAAAEGFEHICSESCAAKALSRWMTRKSASFTANGTVGPRKLEAVKAICS